VKRDLFIACQQDIPIESNLVLVSEPRHSRSLSDLQSGHLMKRGSPHSVRDVLLEARQLYDQELLKFNQNGAGLEFTASASAMKAVMAHFSELVPSDLLRKWLWAANPCGNNHFVASRTLATHLGIHSALQLLTGCLPPNADAVSVAPDGLYTADLMSPVQALSGDRLCELIEAGKADEALQILYMSRVESLSKMIRCSRLVVSTFSPSMLLGYTSVSLGAAFDAITEHRNVAEVMIFVTLLCSVVQWLRFYSAVACRLH
jgi:hypothetical protein